MRHTKVVCENIVQAKPEVVKWNSWDGEHLRTIHRAYDKPISLMTRPNDGLFIDRFRIPFLGIRIKAMVFTTQWDNSNQISFVLTPFFVGKNTINITPIDERRTKVTVSYEFSGTILQSFLFPVFKLLIKKWNKTVWDEDLPLKLRRQKALEYGFIDFQGCPTKISERHDRSASFQTEIPVPMVMHDSKAEHPFFIRKYK